MAFLRDLEASPDIDYFQPHPFTDEAIDKIIQDSRLDLYYVVVAEANVLAYGMLRGWDEGYDIPSLGIATHPGFRNIGLGKALMHFLSAAAKCRGARTIRLRVRSDNAVAVKLYSGLGYEFQSEANGYRVGFLKL